MPRPRKGRSGPKAPERSDRPQRSGRAPKSAPAEAILAAVKAADAASGKREIARALKVKGSEARKALRETLRDLEHEGEIVRTRGKRVKARGALPPTSAIDILSVDDDGDLIAAPSEWDGPADPPMIRIRSEDAARHKPAPGPGDRVLARLIPAGDDGYQATIIRALGRGAHRFLAVFRASKHGGVAEPVEKRARTTFQIDKGDTGEAKDGDLVWIETKNARGYGPNRARVRAIAGHIDDRHSFSLIAVASHGIPIEFPESALSEAAKAKLPALGKRRDLRETPLLTIDPEDARDHDDAVFAAPDDDPANAGGFRVIVAIADVCAFVAPGGALDREAEKRGNSVYLPDRVVPMLPERLSNDLCSLKPAVDRPCLFVEMTIDAKGRKLSHRFDRGLMRSAAKLAYRDAQDIIDGADAPEPIKETVTCLYAAYKARMEERRHRAPMDLDLVERRVVLNPDGAVARIERRERFDAHRLIEEFMILANIAAAETLEQKKFRLIYRVHDTPDAEKLESLRDYLDGLGYALINSPSVRPQHFNQILKLAEARGEKEMVSEVVLRSQRQAVYATANLGHFGLNLARYAHFTSPIRRYADLTVHRALIAALKLGAGGQSEDEAARLSKIAEKISDCERRAMAAERDAKDRYLAEHLEARIGEEFDGRIRGVVRFGLFVMLDETGADGFCPARDLGPDYWRHDEAAHALVSDATGAMYRIGQSVRVRLEEAAPLTGALRFTVVSDPVEGERPRLRPAKKGRPGGRAPTKGMRSKGKRRR